MSAAKGPVREAIGSAFRAIGRSWRKVLAVEILFKVLGTVLFAAASSAVLAWVQARTGRSAVTNVDLVGFLARPQRIAVALVGLAGFAAFLMVEHGVLLALLAKDAPAHPTLGARLRAASGAVVRIARLGALYVGVMVLVVGVAGALLGATYATLLGGHDINFYLSGKPPVFFVALAIGAAVGVAAGSSLVFLFVRWFLSLPITIFEGLPPRRAMAAARDRVRGAFKRVVLILAGWHGMLAAISAVVFLGFRPLALRLVEAAGSSERRVVAVLIAVLAAHTLALWVGSFVSMVGHALIVLGIYESGRPPELSAQRREHATDSTPLLSAPVAVGLVVVALLTAAVVPALLLISRLGKQERIEITAHRGDSKRAPENTLAAIRSAIEAGADWAEIDVQETADGHVLVLHDQDLMRLAGDPRKISELSFEDARKLDVGAKFDPKFAGERLPTLEEAIDLARGKIRLNIELKYYGEGDPRLARDVARILREQRCERDCFVASLNYASLLEAKKEWPQLRTAAIVSARVGDPTLLDADILSMNGKLVDPSFVRRAHLRGKRVLVWTVDDAKLATRFMEVGVDDVITNDPERMVRLRDDREALPRAARLVLAFRVAVGAEIEAPGEDASIPEL